MNDTLMASITELRRKLENDVNDLKNDPKMAEVIKIYTALNTLEDLVGEPRTSLTRIFNLNQESEESKFNRDDFYGLIPLEAAKRFLKKKGRACQFNEIVDAIRSGGCEVSSEDELRVSLGRSTLEIAKVGNDFYGLVEFYPHIKRGRKKRVLKNGSEESSAEDEKEDGGMNKIDEHSDQIKGA